jgi:two-component system chemotaxis response regulator CheB
MEALRALLAALPANFPAALAIVQHRATERNGELAILLGQACPLPVGFPLDKERILAGRVYLAPPNYHLLVEGDHFAFSLDAPENYARPSIDVLFESAADACGAGVTGIVLTGTGRDGAHGLAVIHRRGGLALVQSPKEAAAPEMPLAALAAVPDARQLTLKEMGALLARMAR